tara:strand:+ start:469 stop:969 length:501 start_codon:yes stop_codon:yes gene_type:complete
MIIKIFPYKKDLSYLKFLEDNFGEKKNYCLLENKTIVINIVNQNNLLGTICLLENNHLMKFLENSNPDAAGNYIFRAAKGVHIYNFTVDKKNRGKKVGKKLLNICMHVVKKLGYEYCHSHVLEDSLSDSMFSKLGFTRENVIQTETRNKKDLLFGKRELTNMTYWV